VDLFINIHHILLVQVVVVVLQAAALLWQCISVGALVVRLALLSCFWVFSSSKRLIIDVEHILLSLLVASDALISFSSAFLAIFVTSFNSSWCNRSSQRGRIRVARNSCCRSEIHWGAAIRCGGRYSAMRCAWCSCVVFKMNCCKAEC
jgi:hypothetical protein